MLPQALPCLAAVLRENDIEVKPIDCLPLKLGWNSLRKRIEKEQPDIVGVCTSETLFVPEGIKACKMVKEINPKILTVVGGTHFSNLAEESLRNNPIDVVAIGEGEYTLLDVVREAGKSNPDFKNVKGIAFKKNDNVRFTKPRPLIENLDDLPMPAYDLMPMDKYGKTTFLYSPGGTTIHHGRGCTHNCEFCVWWVQMAQRSLKNNKFVCHPKWRTKSVERTLDEIEFLEKKYNKKYLEFTDGTWNVDPNWNKKFAEEYLERGLKTQWFGFMRPDLMLRDEKLGILKKIVDAGLIRVCIGVERAIDSELNEIGKSSYSSDNTKKCFHILRDKYPQVFRQGTFIVGVRNETKESLMRQVKYAKELDLDFPAFHPLTPIPGTAFWEKAKKNNWIEVEDFSHYDWMTPIMSSEHLSRDEIENIIYSMNKEFVSPKWFLKGLTDGERYKRNMYIWWLIISLRIMGSEVKDRVIKSKKGEGDIFHRMIKPKWYDD
jgi:anaerobic magnesium-protoporphyrin IX monomethyl ester cyclase